MTLKLGQRVTVKFGVSTCKDAESLKASAAAARSLGLPPDHPMATVGVGRDHLVGQRGEVVQIGTDVLKIRKRVGTNGELVDANEAAAIVPPGCEDHVLVDNGVRNGVREGPVPEADRPATTIREWFREVDLEVG